MSRDSLLNHLSKRYHSEGLKFSWPTHVMYAVEDALVHPAPRSSNTGIKSYPCGGNAFWGQGQAITSLKPGEMIIKWEETISHKGSPFHIAISAENDNNYDKIILVDHIPHNDQGSASDANPKPYSFKITIPDINCTRCSLGVYNPMTDKIPKGSCCPYPTGTDKCFSVYHSCSNIIITGKTPVAQYTHKYTGPTGPYTQESGQWNYDTNNKTWTIGNYIVNTSCGSTPTTSPGNGNSASTPFISSLLIMFVITIFLLK
eukprot:gene3030-5040_t